MADDDVQPPKTKEEDNQNNTTHEQPNLSEGGFTFFSMPAKVDRSTAEEKSEQLDN